MANSDQTRNDLSDPAAIATELAEEAADDVVDTAKDLAERAKYQKYLLEHSPGLGGAVSRFARDRPIEALLVSAAAAFVIGSMWKFRSRSVD
jgi:hypothetical protein